MFVECMRILLGLVLLLTTLLTLWCALEFVGAQAQQIDTRAELSQSQITRLSDNEIAVHVSRIGRQGRNWAIATVLAGASAVAVLAAMILAGKKPTA